MPDFEVSVHVASAEEAKGTLTCPSDDSLAGLPNVRLVGPVVPAKNAGGEEVRGVAIAGIALAIFSSGAATALIQAIQTWARRTRISKYTLKFHDPKSGEDIALELDHMDKAQTDEVIAALRAYLEARGAKS